MPENVLEFKQRAPKEPVAKNQPLKKAAGGDSPDWDDPGFEEV